MPLGWVPKGEDRIPNIHFPGAFAVSFRECVYISSGDDGFRCAKDHNFPQKNSPATTSGSVSNTGMDLEQDGFSGNSKLGGDFRYFLCSPLFAEMIPFD